MSNGPHPLHRETCAPGHHLLHARNLEVGYGGRALLPPITLDIQCGDFLAVVGRNGAGKTTLFRTLLGLLPAVAGSVERLNASVAYVPQRMAFDDIYPVQVRDVVGMGLLRARSSEELRPATEDRVLLSLEEVGIQSLARRTFRSLSEGQKQKVLMARVLASGARLVFLDEPTAAMDSVAERETMDLLAHLQSVHGMALVVVNHHMEVALRLASRVLFLDPEVGAPLMGPPTEVIHSSAFKKRYGEVAFEVVHA